jgi:hypothetical protein
MAGFMSGAPYRHSDTEGKDTLTTTHEAAVSPAAPMLGDVRDIPTARPATRAPRLDTIVA